MMAILICPDDMPADMVHCALCCANVPLAQATLGPTEDVSRPAFACERHMLEGVRLFLEWMTFMQVKRHHEAAHVITQELAEV